MPWTAEFLSIRLRNGPISPKNQHASYPFGRGGEGRHLSDNFSQGNNIWEDEGICRPFEAYQNGKISDRGNFQA
jgi:hypothetical protein